jgi:hypothetical protein
MLRRIPRTLGDDTLRAGYGPLSMRQEDHPTARAAAVISESIGNPPHLSLPPLEVQSPFYLTMQARPPRRQGLITAQISSLKARPRVRTRREDPIFMPDQRTELPSEALLLNERTHTMFSNAEIARHKSTVQNLIDQVINAGLIALVGCSIAAALAIGAPMSGGGSPTAMPTSEWQSLFDQRVFRASSHEPRMQRLVGTVNAPVGQGWG